VTDPETFFLQQVTAMAKSMGAFAEVTPHEEELSLELRRDAEGAPVLTAYLQNLYSDTRDLAPAERAARVRYFLEGVAEPPNAELTWDEAQSRVFAVLRSPAMFAALPPGKPVVAMRSLPCLYECVALDLGRTFSYVAEAQVSEWGCSLEELFERARTNVERELDHTIEPWDIAAPYPMWHVSANDAYESSRLLAPSFLRGMREHVTGRLVCAIPERSTMLLVGDASNDSIARLAEAAERQYMSSTRGISPALYSVDEHGEVAPLEVALDHPLAFIVRRGHVLLANAEYAEQKRTLDAEHEKQERDLFVATFIATQRDAELRTIATWSQDVDTLLPVVDYVAFVTLDEYEEPKDSILVPWQVVMETAGDCLEEVKDLWPTRFHTKRYPNDSELAKLREAAITD
jgi:uncharacterized protein YtpQ (UPF0354 family)